jgi:hypothetical protein
MAAPAPRTRDERLVAEFAGKQALLVTLIAEPALRAQVALTSLSGTKEEHYEAAAAYSLPMLRALTAMHGPPADAKLTYWAAREGQLVCLRYLHENGCPWDAMVTYAAAERGHLACLQYLLEKGCLPNAETAFRAALHGRLECLQLLHSMNAKAVCPWDARATYAAAAGGHLPCLQFLHEKGCPWEGAIYVAAACDHLSCLQYADENGCPWGNQTTKLAKGACIEYCRARAARQA